MCSLSVASFWHYFHFPGTNFLRLRRAAHHLHAMLHLGGGQCSSLGASARYARARIEFFASPSASRRQVAALAARVQSIARHVERRAALTVAALAAICSAFRLLACRCTVFINLRNRSWYRATGTADRASTPPPSPASPSVTRALGGHSGWGVGVPQRGGFGALLGRSPPQRGLVGSISGRSHVDLGSISVRSRFDLGSISGRSRAKN